jgi:hypothetical protein
MRMISDDFNSSVKGNQDSAIFLSREIAKKKRLHNGNLFQGSGIKI